MAKRTGRRLALLATTVLAALPLAETAQAQSANDSTLQRMNAIESQIKSLQDQLRAMRRDLTDRDNQLRAAQREASRAHEEAQRAQAAAVRAPAPRYGQAQQAPGQPQGGGAPGLAVAGATGAGQLTTGQQNASTTPERCRREPSAWAA